MTSALQLANDIADDFGLCLEQSCVPYHWYCDTTFHTALKLRRVLGGAGFTVSLDCSVPHRSTITVDLAEELGEMRAEQDACTTREMGR